MKEESWELSIEAINFGYLLEHLLQVLKDCLLEVLALLDVEGIKLFSDNPGNLLEVLLGHVHLGIRIKGRIERRTNWLC